jgi:choline-sulfatase
MEKLTKFMKRPQIFSFNRALTSKAISLLVLGAGFGSAQEVIAVNNDKKPNIIFIISDEHNARIMGCNGDPIVSTPNLDALAAKGILFRAHYCSSSICAPSRQTLLIGKYVSHHNVWTNTICVPNDTPSLPGLLRKSGYESVLIGGMKFGSGRDYGLATYTAEKKLVLPKNRNNKAEDITPKQRKRVQADLFKDNGNEIGKEFTPIGVDAEDMKTFVDVKKRDDAISFIQERKMEDKPFFLIVGFMAPHYPLVSTAVLVAKYKDKVQKPDLPEGYVDKLPLNYKHLRNERQLEKVPPEIVKLGRESYYARVEWIDQQIGQVLDAVSKSPLADNTIIIYTADHGENIGEHGLWWKNSLYDTSANVPLIISWPGRWKGGQKRAEACASVDLVQTMAELGGIKVPSDWDGTSMVPWLDNPTYKWKNMAVSEYYAGYTSSGIAMIRKGNLKYVYHTRADEKHGPEIELFDLSNDPKELNNLSKEVKYSQTIKSMHAGLVKELGEDPEETEGRWRAGAIPEAPFGIMKKN